MKKLLILTVLLLLAANTFAITEPVITRLADDLNQYIDLDPEGRGDCIYGNLNPPNTAIPNWIQGNQRFSYYIYFPSNLDCSCQLGFHIEDVSMVLQFGAEDVPAQFDVFSELAQMNWRMMPLPGLELCTGNAFTISIDQPGLYEIVIPLADQCDCAFLDYPYFITFHIPTTFPEAMRPDLVIDDFPNEGYTSYISDDGDSWMDVFYQLDFPGNLVMKANVLCCEFPVGTEVNTMGGIKSLYR